MTTVEEFLGGAVRNEHKVPRDQFGRYLIVPEGTDKPIPHQRVTTFAKILDDRYGLEKWDLRMTAKGLALRPDILARVAAARDDDKSGLDKLCKEAKEAAGSQSGSNYGQALHSFTERVDLGEEFHIPPPWDADIAAYRAALKKAEVGIRPDMIERYVVLPEFKIAGTLDRIVDFGSLPKIADVKTGSIEKAQGSIAIQLALYAHAETFYDFDTKKHTPMITVDQDVALVIHLPVGAAACSLYWVDITAGWEAVQHGLWIRDSWRKRKDLIDLWEIREVRLDLVVERRTAFEERIETLRQIPGALSRLALAWPPGVPTLKNSPTHTPAQLNLIDQALTSVEAQVKAPFGPLDNKENQ